MARYLVFLAADGSAVHIDHSLIHALGMSVRQATCSFAIATQSEEDFIPFETDEGGFIGRIFRRDGERLRSIPRGFANVIVEGRGGDALNGIWGSYVMVACDMHRPGAAIARDPSGGLPVFMAQREGHVVLGARAADVLLACDIRPNVSTDAVIKHLVFPDMPRTTTCLEGLDELLPGQQLCVTNGSRQIAHWWSPQSHVATGDLADARASSARLLEALKTCVDAWAGCYERIGLSLSGGLDSSLIAALLPRGSPTRAFNFSGADPDSDERLYARIAATATGMDLSELWYDANCIDLAGATLPHWPRPIGKAHMQLHRRALQELGVIALHDAHFMGLGGDQVFCSMHSVLPVIDRAMTAPGRVGAWSVSGEVAAIAGVSRAAVLRRAAATFCRGRRPDRRSGLQAFLRADALDAVGEGDGVSWPEGALGGLPGARYHAEMIARVLPYLHDGPDAEGPQFVAPLLSQPVVEACLSIPTWQWVAEGQNRAQARILARQILPREIAERRSKSGPDSLSHELCRRHGKAILYRLCHGRLAAAGVVDRSSVELALRPDRMIAAGQHRGILDLLEAELWMEHWQERAS